MLIPFLLTGFIEHPIELIVSLEKFFMMIDDSTKNLSEWGRISD